MKPKIAIILLTTVLLAVVGYILGVEQSQNFCDFNSACIHPLFRYTAETAKHIGTGLGAFCGLVAGFALSRDF